MIKMKYIIYSIVLIISFFIVVSCEKDVTVDLPRPKPKIVVEGAVEPGLHPYVILTRNTGYFDPVDTNTLANMIVLGAIVTVNDGTSTDTLKITLDAEKFPYILYKAENMVGEVGRTYDLKIEVEGKVLTSKTTIPPIVPIDSIWFKLNKEDEKFDTMGVVWFRFADPPELGNNHAVFTYSPGRDRGFVHPFWFVDNDKLTNGQPKVDFAVFHGLDSRDTTEYKPDDNTPYYFNTNETVIVKFCSLDASLFDFWSSMLRQQASEGNPFSSPSSVNTNIKGDALGVWGGYGAYYDTIVCIPDTISAKSTRYIKSIKHRKR